MNRAGQNARVILALFVGVFAFLLLGHVTAADNLYGSIRGSVMDPSGAAVPGAAVTATNIATGVAASVTSSATGAYSFLQLAIGDYSLKVEKDGFETFAVARIHLDLSTVYVQDVKLTLGAVGTQVLVEGNQVQVETSTTQLGTVIDANQIVNMPLIGRDFTYLQQLEPGVMASSDRFGNNGDTEPDFSTNGAQSQMNAYLIDGTDTTYIALNQPNFIPSPDAISEFRMVTSTMNPEFARSSGAILNATIKSGANSFHGDLFEFYRDSSLLDSANYFAVPHVPSVYQQNLFGATLGGPIIKNRTFFFFSYQGLRATQPQTNPIGPNIVTNVYTTTQLGGNFGTGAFATSTNTSPFPLWGTPCPPTGPKCPAGTPYSTLFSSGTIPTQDFNSLSNALLKKYVPPGNFGPGLSQYSFNASQPTTRNQYITRIDHTFSVKDTLWGTYFQEGYANSDTVPFNGGDLPGFGQVDLEHWKLLTVSWTHIFNDHFLNEFRVGWDRTNYHSVFPSTPTTPSSLGFSITPQDVGGADVPYIGVAGLFTLGFSDFGPQPTIDSVYQGVDNLQLVKGKHTLKFGFDFRRFYDNEPFFGAFNNGFYQFASFGVYSTGNAGADFLLGIPAYYLQGSGAVQDNYADQFYSFIQDQYKFRPNLTLIYGISWVVDTPMLDVSYGDHAQVAWRPGVQSTIFPGAPVGVVYQGDPGVDAAGQTHFHDFGPRLGFAWSPDLGWMSGGPGKLSIRGGFGIYYDRSEGEQNLQTLGVPPFAVSSAFGPTPGGFNPSFANPFVDIATGAVQPNPYPFKSFPSNVNFLTTPGLTPIWGSCCATLSPDTRDPAAFNYNLTIERQLSSSMILTLGYVGSESRYLTYGVPQNFPNAAGVTPYNLSVYGAIDELFNGGNSSYNSFQAEINQHLSHNVQYLVSYTYSHSIDDSSGFENSTFGGIGGGNIGYGGYGAIRASNPYCFPKCDVASSGFDARQRLVMSYFYQLPGMNSSALISRLTKGWTIAGITTFQTGFPLDVYDSSFPSGGYAAISAVSDFTSWEGPNQVGPVSYENPHAAGNMWFNPSAFARVSCAPACSNPTLPTSYGDAPRNLMRGPGINNWDFQLYKDTQISESTRFEIRMEAYNVFNHTQFNPLNVITDINNPAFGSVDGAYNPRRIQLAAKFYF